MAVEYRVSRSSISRRSSTVCRSVMLTGVAAPGRRSAAERSPDAAQLRSGAAMAELCGALLGREHRGPGGEVLEHVGDGDLGHHRLRVLVGLVEASLQDAPWPVGLVEPVVHARVLLGHD